MRLLCITNPATHSENDTTPELYRRFAAHPEIELFHADPRKVSADDAVPCVSVSRPLAHPDFLRLSENAQTPMAFADFDLVFCRSDLPFPPYYLEHLAKKEGTVRFVNRPSSLIEAGAREFTHRIAERFKPPSIFATSRRAAIEFIETHGAAVAKENASYGGRGVIKITREGGSWQSDRLGQERQRYETITQLVAVLLPQEDQGIELVELLRDTSQGDKRVLVVGGEIYGALLRRSTNGSWIHNLTAGGAMFPAEVTSFEEQVVRETWPTYRHLGINTLGYDFLPSNSGGWILSEINVGNIGAYEDLEAVSGFPACERLSQFLLTFASAA